MGFRIRIPTIRQLVRQPGRSIGGIIEGRNPGAKDFLKRREAVVADQAKRDKTINDMNEEVRAQARSFRAGLPQYKDEQYGLVAREGAKNLENNLNTIQRSSNQRGLLYSGLRRGAEVGARGAMAATLAQQRADINRSADRLADSYDNTAANIGLAGFGDAVRRSESELQNATQAAIERRRNLAELGSGIGYGFGSLYGRTAERSPQGQMGLMNTGQSYRGRGNVA